MNEQEPKPLECHKQEYFCHEYIRHLNQARAYSVAYDVSINDAYSNAWRIMKDEGILRRIEELKKERAERNKIESDMVIQDLIAVKEKCMQDVEVMAYNRDTKRMEPTGQYVFKEVGALKALELLGKHIGMFKEKSESEVTIKTESIEEYIARKKIERSKPTSEITE